MKKFGAPSITLLKIRHLFKGAQPYVLKYGELMGLSYPLWSMKEKGKGKKKKKRFSYNFFFFKKKEHTYRDLGEITTLKVK